jgi:hypothetical protein
LGERVNRLSAHHTGFYPLSGGRAAVHTDSLCFVVRRFCAANIAAILTCLKCCAAICTLVQRTSPEKQVIRFFLRSPLSFSRSFPNSVWERAGGATTRKQLQPILHRMSFSGNNPG